MRLQGVNYNIRAGVLRGLLEEIVALYDEVENADKHLFAPVINEMRDLTEAYRQRKFLRYSGAKLKELDQDRLKILYNLFKLMKAYRVHPAVEVYGAANYIIDRMNLKPLTQISRWSYFEKNSFIGGLIDHFEKPEYKSKINALSGCPELLQRLNVHNNIFVSAMEAKHKVDTRKSSETKANEYRAQMLDCVNGGLIPLLTYLLAVHSHEDNRLVNSIVEVIEKENSNVKLRKTVNAKKKKEKDDAQSGEESPGQA